jgi:hypothetical protein
LSSSTRRRSVVSASIAQRHASSVDPDVKIARVPSPISFSTSPPLSCTAEITASA